MSAAAISVVWDTVGRYRAATILGPDFKYGSPPSSRVESSLIESSEPDRFKKEKRRNEKSDTPIFSFRRLEFLQWAEFQPVTLTPNPHGWWTGGWLKEIVQRKCGIFNFIYGRGKSSNGLSGYSNPKKYVE